MIHEKPMLIEIVFVDHVHTATVHDLKSLERFCSQCVRSRRTFRFGSIFSYGSHNISRICQVMNRIRRFGTFDRSIQRPEGF